MNPSFARSWLTPDGTATPDADLAPAQLSNQQLILRCQQGVKPDRAAFSELLRRHQSHVEKMLYHLAPDWSDRADLVQEVWIRVYRNIQRLKDPMKFRGWLSRITTNLFYDELRKRKRFKSPISLDAPRQIDDGELTLEVPTDFPSPDQDLSSQEFYDQLNRAIAELPESFRSTIVLREIEGLSYEEIAEITGVSLGTVKSRIARARAKLQDVLQPYFELD
ncbi:RNA polymerase, sigma subunit, ECF family [Halothece sp. PCC 7418]|uniref:sigma-70 family RNA polymerase sigma factor n=1 Tax=Halothece sp. (strain PCC 7418) TaxID=65093 RepID=UPI0002A06D33|nr:sigma-70 family RNA polymerase sigma factor [Halothece sp. PCC 7418]AFZ43724.1 RNA polymerase, sigma subunit, ECF family [Halothece sp. PCC 7418]